MCFVGQQPVRKASHSHPVVERVQRKPVEEVQDDLDEGEDEEEVADSATISKPVFVGLVNNLLSY